MLHATLDLARRIDRAEIDFCAMAAGFSSLAKGASRHFAGGPVRQTVVEMESAYLFVTAAGQGTCLAVVSDADADIGLIAYEMAMLVTRVGQYLTSPVRAHSSRLTMASPLSATCVRTCPRDQPGTSDCRVTSSSVNRPAASSRRVVASSISGSNM